MTVQISLKLGLPNLQVLIPPKASLTQLAQADRAVETALRNWTPDIPSHIPFSGLKEANIGPRNRPFQQEKIAQDSNWRHTKVRATHLR